MRVSKAIRVAVLASALAVGAALGTAIGSAGGPYDERGCPPERIGHSVFTYAEGGGYASPEETLAALAPFLAADGAREQSEYAEALASTTGPTRFEPDTGKLYIDDKVEARIALVQLADGTWTVDSEMLCHRPVPPELVSPYPTPGFDEVAAEDHDPRANARSRGMSRAGVRGLQCSRCLLFEHRVTLRNHVAADRATSQFGPTTQATPDRGDGSSSSCSNETSLKVWSVTTSDPTRHVTISSPTRVTERVG